MASFSAFEDFHFLKGFLENPFKVASPFPSSRRLARCIAAQIDRMHLEPVLELGPGTGAVTQAIIERGIPQSHVWGIERDAKFAAHLAQRFPRMQVLEGDAFSFVSELDAAGFTGLFSAIVCGVPVLSQSTDARVHFLRAAIDRLKPGCPLVQFTYSRKPPLEPVDGIEARHAASVWAGVLPLHVWVYRA